MDPDVVVSLVAQATLVTPNRRLALHLRRQFDVDRQTAGLTTWPSPDILPWVAWVARLHADLVRFSEGPRVLSPAEEQALWQQAIADSPQADGLLDTVAAARMAVAAAGLDIVWRLRTAQWIHGRSSDCDAWLGWGQRVGHVRQARRWISPAALVDQLASLLPEQPALAPQRLILVGFDDLTPQERELLAVLREIGTDVDERRPDAVASIALQRAYASAADELTDVAHRIRALLDADPALRIGVVVPDLAARRPEVVRLFDDTLEPARVIGAQGAAVRPYNISLGVPLADAPMVATALTALRLVHRELPLTEIGHLLRSPFLGDGETEASARAVLDAALRERGQLVVRLPILRREAGRSNRRPGSGCRLLLARLDAWEPLANEARGLRQLPSAWSGSVVALLTALGWPGERTLDSEEFQTWQKWREVVSGLSVLDEVLGRLGFGAALSWLSRLCSDTLFQAESGAVPVQILGLLEAAGQTFDHLFVTGLHDEAWPPPARPNPFLPAALQRQRGVPHASAEWESGFAGRSTVLLRGAASRVMFSHPTREGDRELRASPLLAGIPPAEPAATVEHHSYWRSMRAAARMEHLTDTWAPALARPHHSVGGTDVFRDQSACPFRAFARHRLGARTLDEAGVGIDASGRGLLLHAALAALWGALESRERLAAMAPGAVDAAVAHAIDAAWVEFRRRPGNDDLSEALIAIERARMRRLLAAMLEVERTRPPFTVRDREAPRRLVLNGLEVDGRIDRIDELDDGTLVIIDYKTGKDMPGVWGKDRPEQPQLPLYAVLEAGDVGAIAFGKARTDGVGYVGVGNAASAFDGVTAVEESKALAGEGDWRSLVERWRGRLQSLADEFLDGRADVDPTNGALTCRYCDLGGLCRVGEVSARRFGGAADDDADAGHE